MYRTLNRRHLKILRRNLFVGSTLAIALAVATPLHAQTSSYQPATNNVSINWNALNNAGQVRSVVSTQGYASAPVSQSGLLIPGTRMPRSTLHVAPPAGSSSVQLSKPGTKKAAPKPAMAKAPAPAPTPKVAAAPAPKPATPAPSAPKKLAEKKPAALAPTTSASAPPPPSPTTISASAPPPPPMPATAEAPKAPAISAAPATTEQASTASATSSDDGAVQVIFNGGDTKLSADGQAAVDRVLGELEKSDGVRVQLMAYAVGDDLTASQARRISLSRALSVRSYLIEKGVRSSRIDVRALGDKGEGDPKNRVDVNLIDR
jgi:outer membrane protein OmpA-like peptidoglycan-associated protein